MILNDDDWTRGTQFTRHLALDLICNQAISVQRREPTVFCQALRIKKERQASGAFQVLIRGESMKHQMSKKSKHKPMKRRVSKQRRHNRGKRRT